MIKAILLVCLLSFAASKTWDVTVFRGLTPIVIGTMQFEEINNVGVMFRNTKLTPKALENPDFYNDVVFPPSEGSKDLIMPLRTTSTWNLSHKSNLGSMLKTRFKTDDGDEFELTIAFGFCSNDFDISEFNALLSFIEQKRLVANELLMGYMKSLKKESTTYIFNANLLDEFNNDHFNLKKDEADCQARIADYDAKLKAKNEEIKAAEDKEFDFEKKTTEVCSREKICEANIYTFEVQIKDVESQIAILQKRIEGVFQSTDSIEKERDQVYMQLITNLDEISKFNPRAEKLSASKTELFNAELLKRYFVASK